MSRFLNMSRSNAWHEVWTRLQGVESWAAKHVYTQIKRVCTHASLHACCLFPLYQPKEFLTSLLFGATVLLRIGAPYLCVCAGTPLSSDLLLERAILSFFIAVVECCLGLSHALQILANDVMEKNEAWVKQQADQAEHLTKTYEYVMRGFLGAKNTVKI